MTKALLGLELSLAWPAHTGESSCLSGEGCTRVLKQRVERADNANDQSVIRGGVSEPSMATLAYDWSALNPLWDFFSTECFEKLWNELNESHHHQNKTGIKLTGCIITAIFFCLIQQQVFKAQTFNRQLIVD